MNSIRITEIIDQNKRDYPHDGILRLSLLSSQVMKAMAEAESMDQVKAIYGAYKHITYNTDI